MAELLDVLRTEKKYPVQGAVAYSLAAKLRQVLPLDPHCVGGAGYLVRSLYFDSFSNRDFFEKEAGLERRKKIRLRAYGAAGPVKLEWKEKQGAVQRKRSLVVTAEDAKLLAQGRYRCLKNYSEPLARQFYTYLVSQAYAPRCLVQYRRLAFAVDMNDTRVTLDSELRSHEGAFDLFAPRPPLYPVAAPGAATLEVKYDHFLPGYVKDVLSPFLVTETASSKYYAARRYGLGGTSL